MWLSSCLKMPKFSKKRLFYLFFIYSLFHGELAVALESHPISLEGCKTHPSRVFERNLLKWPTGDNKLVFRMGVGAGYPGRFIYGDRYRFFEGEPQATEEKSVKQRKKNLLRN